MRQFLEVVYTNKYSNMSSDSDVRLVAFSLRFFINSLLAAIHFTYFLSVVTFISYFYAQISTAFALKSMNFVPHTQYLH